MKVQYAQSNGFLLQYIRVLCIFNWELMEVNMLLWLNILTRFIMLVFILLKYILCVRWVWQQGRYQSASQFICNAKPVCMLRHFICENFLETFCIYSVALMRPVEGVNKFNREEWQVQLTPVLNLWKKLNQVCNINSTRFYCPLLKLLPCELIWKGSGNSLLFYLVRYANETDFFINHLSCRRNLFIYLTYTAFGYRKLISCSGLISCRIISYTFKLGLKKFLVAVSFFPL